jgi:hypothetical protein
MDTQAAGDTMSKPPQMDDRRTLAVAFIPIARLDLLLDWSMIRPF